MFYPYLLQKQINNLPYNLALGKPVTASSEESINLASYGNDNKLTTRWCAEDGSVGHWWKVDLGALYSVESYEIKWESVKIYRYKIEISTNDIDWILAVDKQNTTDNTQIQVGDLVANTRYVKITITGLESGVWSSFYELKVLGR